MAKSRKVKIFVLNEKKGVFFNEEMCKIYCEIYGYTYREDYMVMG